MYLHIVVSFYIFLFVNTVREMTKTYNALVRPQ